jgi:GT2 family glycosyltransferase
MKIAIVILNWRDADATIRCASMLLNKFESTCIYIVDNNSGDGSYEKLQISLSHCKVSQSGANGGYTAGNNFGLAAAFSDGFEAALILNNDVLPYFDDQFEDVVTTLLRTNEFNLIGVQVKDQFNKIVFPQQPSLFMRKLFSSVLIDDSLPLICGCAMLISRKMYNSFGGLHEPYFMYCEELEYSIRVTANNGRVICPSELGFVIRDEHEIRRPYVYYYQTRNLLSLVRTYAKSEKALLVALVVILSFKQALFSMKIINVIRTFQGIISAFTEQTGQNKSVH